MHSASLSNAMDYLRPSSLEEIIGQEKGIRALMSKLASPFPQHLIIYGPPGVGKQLQPDWPLKRQKDASYAFQPRSSLCGN